jgi:hypothetical protein
MWVEHEWILCLAQAVDGCAGFIFVNVRVVLREGRTNEHAGQREFNLQLWSVRVSISVKISANKANKLEEWLLAPPVYSLRGTHAYDELPFAEPSRAEHTRDGYNFLLQHTFYSVDEYLSF